MLRIAVCDDSFVYCDKIMSILESILIHHKFVIDEYSNGSELLKCLEDENLSYQLFILDVDMPVLNGLDTATKLRDMKHFEDSMIVFLTDYDVDVCRVTDIHPYAYIKKISSMKSIRQKLQACINKLENTDPMVMIKNYDEYTPISLGAIKYILSDNRHAVFCLVDNSKLESSRTFAEVMTDILKISNCFVQSHRSYAVNMSLIRCFKSDKLIFKDDTSVPLSPHYKKNVLEYYGNEMMK